jgi:folylpolyglutamate synthase/dihydropteroate synthase
LGRVIATKAVHPRAAEPGKLVETADRLGIPAEVVVPVEVALARALELSEKDGSLVLSAGSMFVTAEVKTTWERCGKGE